MSTIDNVKALFSLQYKFIFIPSCTTNVLQHKLVIYMYIFFINNHWLIKKLELTVERFIFAEDVGNM